MRIRHSIISTECDSKHNHISRDTSTSDIECPLSSLRDVVQGQYMNSQLLVQATSRHVQTYDLGLYVPAICKNPSLPILHIIYISTRRRTETAIPAVTQSHVRSLKRTESTFQRRKTEVECTKESTFSSKRPRVRPYPFPYPSLQPYH